MLVLSRGENDRIVFPSLGISIEVLKVKGSRTSLGIDAPKSVRVVRQELMTDANLAEMAAISNGKASDSSSQFQHDLRNAINRATLKLQLATKLFERGQIDAGLASLSAGISELSRLNDAGTAVPSASAEPLLGRYHPSTAVADPPSSYETSATSTCSRVLLVDDDVNERTLMASYLRRCGIEVLEAGDGLQALYLLSGKVQPDVILMDMNMPNMGGRQTIERIRHSSQNPNVPVFAVTAEAIETAGVDIDEKGVTAWFQKPVQVDQIVEAIQRCVVAV